MLNKVVMAALLLATLAGACTCCCSRAVPVEPVDWRSGGGNNTYNYSYYNVTDTYYVNYTNYTIFTANYSDYWWYVSGTWLTNNRTAATSGVNVSGVNGNTYLTGNNIEFDRAGPNYITATDPLSSLYLGSGGMTGIIGLLNGAVTNSLRINSHGVGIYTTAADFEFTVAGAVYASENVSTPLVNTSCIVLADERVCSWAAVNGSIGGGSESFNGTFNETEGFYVYNSTPFLINFNDTLLNLTIDLRSIDGELDPHWTANYTPVFSNLSTIWVWLLGLAADNTTHFNVEVAMALNASGQATQIADGVLNDSVQSGQISTLAGYAQANYTAFEGNDSAQSGQIAAGVLNASLQSGDIQSVNNSVVHTFGSEVVGGNKYFTGNVSFTGNVTQYGSDGNRGIYVNETDGTVRIGNETVVSRGLLMVVGQYSAFYRANSAQKGATIRGIHSRGTLSVPTALLDADDLFAFQAEGYDGTGLSTGFSSSGGIVWTALGDFSGTNHGTTMSFQVTPFNSVTVRNALEANGSGIITLPYQSSVQAYNSTASFTFAPAAYQKLTFNSESWDTQSEFTGSRFTALQAGTYLVSYKVNYATAAIAKYVQLRANGAVSSESVSDARTASVGSTTLVQLSAGGYLEVWAFVSASGTIYGGSENTTISIMKVA